MLLVLLIQFEIVWPQVFGFAVMKFHLRNHVKKLTNSDKQHRWLHEGKLCILVANEGGNVDIEAVKSIFYWMAKTREKTARSVLKINYSDVSCVVRYVA